MTVAAAIKSPPTCSVDRPGILRQSSFEHAVEQSGAMLMNQADFVPAAEHRLSDLSPLI